MPEYARGTPLVVSGNTSVVLRRVRDFEERWLQELIHRHPTCLPMDDIEPGVGRLIPACMELPVEVGKIDNLFITPEGHLVVVEVKLWRNPEARRKVVAQALEYATALFRLDYRGLERAVKRGDFDGREAPNRLHDLVDGADALPEALFAERVTRNLRDGRIVVLIVGDGIRPEADDLVAGLQTHANFHFKFALVDMPVYAREPSDSKGEYIVVPGILVKTVTVPRFTIRTLDGTSVIEDAGADEADAKRPSRRRTITSDEFFETMAERASDLPDKLRRFLDEADAINVRTEYKGSLNLKWDQPEGKPVNLGYIRPGGDVWTDASYWAVDRDLAEQYNVQLAKVFGGEVRTGRRKQSGATDRWVTRHDGTAFRIEEVADRLSDWRRAIEDFQDAVLTRAKEADA